MTACRERRKSGSCEATSFMQSHPYLILYQFGFTENRRRLVGGLDRSERDVPRSGEARWGRAESKKRSEAGKAFGCWVRVGDLLRFNGENLKSC